jgi:2-oxoglutarate ferredoxin oxidoreductase subunit delta
MKHMNKVIFETDTCKGCGLCAAACPKGIISLDTSTLNAKGYHPAALTDEKACIACASCAVMCPDAVITVIKE